MMFPVQEIRLLKWVSAGEKTPNFLKYAKKCTWDLGSANKTCLREMWAQNEAWEEMHWLPLSLSWCRKAGAARGSSWHRF